MDERTKFYVVRSKPYTMPFLVCGISMQDAMTKVFAASQPTNIEVEEVIDINDPPIIDLNNSAER